MGWCQCRGDDDEGGWRDGDTDAVTASPPTTTNVEKMAMCDKKDACSVMISLLFELFVYKNKKNT